MNNWLDWLATMVSQLPAFKSFCSSNATLTKNQSLAANKLTNGGTTMANRPTLALIVDYCRLNYVEHCMNKKIAVLFVLVVRYFVH